MTFSSTKTGTTFVMQLVWGAIVWWAGYFTVYVIVGGHGPGLEGYGNPYSSYFVGNPHLWSNAGGVISLVAAFPYLMVFDAVSDTLLLFGYVTLNQKAKPQTPKGETPKPKGETLNSNFERPWTLKPKPRGPKALNSLLLSIQAHGIMGNGAVGSLAGSQVEFRF